MKTYVKLVLSSWKYYALTALNYSITVISIPLLVKILGMSEYGEYELAMSLSMIIGVFIDLGITPYAIRESVRGGVSDAVLIRKTSAIKFVAFLMCIFCVFVFCKLFNADDHRYVGSIYLLATVVGFARSLVPVWYFQAKDMIGVLALVQSSVQIIVVLGGYLLSIYDRRMILSGTLCIAGVVYMVGTGLAWLLIEKKQRLLGDQKGMTLWGIFMSSVVLAPASMLSSVYMYGNNFAVSLFVTPRELSEFAVADRMYRAVAGLLGPLTQSFYPRIIQTIKSSQQEADMLLIRIRSIFVWVSAAIAVLIWLNSAVLIRFATGANDYLSAKYLNLLIIILPISALSRVYGGLWLLPSGRDVQYSAAVTFGAIVYLVLCPTLGGGGGVIGVIVSYILSECVVLFLIVCAAHKSLCAEDSGNRTVV